MKNNLWIFIIILILSIISIIFFNIFFNPNKSNYKAEKISSNNESIYTNNSSKNAEFDNLEINNTNDYKTHDSSSKEELLSTFTTNIYTKEPERQNNMILTCQKLTGTIISPGETFSFCNTLGPSTPQQGYQKADVFDQNGNKVQGIGGGKCQVSSTLYNAALQVPNIKIIERHPHSNKVPYVPIGKDAAVYYGSYDLKFRNDCGYNIKILAEITNNTVTVNLYKL